MFKKLFLFAMKWEKSCHRFFVSFFPRKILKVFLFIFMFPFSRRFCLRRDLLHLNNILLNSYDLNSNVNLLNHLNFCSYLSLLLCRNGTIWTYDGTHQNMAEYVIWEYHRTGYGNLTFLCTIGGFFNLFILECLELWKAVFPILRNRQT